MGTAPSALGLLGPATEGWLRRAMGWARLAARQRRWPEPLRATAALALAACGGAWPALARPSSQGLLGLLGASALVGVFIGLFVRKLAPVAVAAALLGAEYLASQVGRPVAVVPTAGFAALLLALTELAWWAEELSVRPVLGPGVLRRRWALLATLVGEAFVLGVVVGLAGIAGLGPGSVAAVAGAAGALAMAFALASLVRDLSGR